MKLSEMETDRALDATLEIAECSQNILKDENFKTHLLEVVALKKRGIKTIDQLTMFGMQVVGELITPILQTHRVAIYKILAIINDKEVEEIKKQNLLSTINMIKDAFNDPDLIQVFFSDWPIKATTSSAPAQESTTDN